jgi:hypothetical protein
MSGIHKLDNCINQATVDNWHMLIFDSVTVIGDCPKTVTDDSMIECMWASGYFVAKQRNSVFDSFILWNGSTSTEITKGATYFVAAVNLSCDAVYTQ